MQEIHLADMKTDPASQVKEEWQIEKIGMEKISERN
jgi:hypothetical protein